MRTTDPEQAAIRAANLRMYEASIQERDRIEKRNERLTELALLLFAAAFLGWVVFGGWL